ncbi:MAG: transposase [Actinomycetota bacterium]|nr:transposase [Actinomycetota bacterium]
MAGRKRTTRRFRDQLAQAAIRQPFSDVAASEKVSWWRVADAFEAHAEKELARPAQPPRVVSLDESAFRRRFRYHTVISDPERGVILELSEGRDQAAAREGLEALPSHLLEGIETVVIDLHWPYRKAVESLLPRARLVADKFPVLRSVDHATQRVRVRHGRKAWVRGRDGGVSRQHNPRFDRQVWRSRWTFMRRAQQLSPDEAATLGDVFCRHPPIGVAWWMKEAFAAIYGPPAERRPNAASTCGCTTWRRPAWRNSPQCGGRFGGGGSPSSTTSTTARPTALPRGSPTRSRS